MSVIIRLQNLPWSANSLDIRQYFQGLSIPEGGVHIVGGELGDAFIAFSTDEDARQAMLTDGGKIKEVKIKLFLSSRSEMQKVIETARAQSLSLQTFMQMPSAQIPVIPGTQIPPTPTQTAPAMPPMPPISQVQAKPATQEIKPPPMPPVPTIPITEVVKPEAEVEKKDQDTDSVSSKDGKRGRKGRSRSKSKNRSKSRDRSKSRERSKSRDRSRSRDRNHRRKDSYRDRRRRNRSRSRDRRDRRKYNRDRSRSRDRSRKTSKDRKRDYERNERNSLENSNDAAATNAVEKELPVPQSLAPPLPAGKPGFSSTGWVTTATASSTDKTSGPVLSTPVGFSISKTPVTTTSQPTRPGMTPSAQQIPMPQQIQLPNQMMAPHQIPVPQQAAPTSQPLHMPPQPPNFPSMPMDIPKDQDGRRFGPPVFPPVIPQQPNIPISQPNSLFGRNQAPMSQNETNKIMSQNETGRFPNATGWPSIRPPMDPSMMFPMQDMGSSNSLDNQHMSSPMTNMGMFMRPPIMTPSDKFQPPYVKHDPRMQSDYTQSQIRNDRPFPSPNYSGREFDSSNSVGMFTNSCVEIRDMSINTNSADIRRFFQGLHIPENGVKIITDKKGNKVGIAYVRFAKVFFKDMALKKTGQLLNNSPVEVLHIDDHIFDKATDFSELSESYLDETPGYPKNYNESFRRPNEPEHFTDLIIHEVPPYAKDREIYNLFKGLKVIDAFVLSGTGRKTATGYVRFQTPVEARKALAGSSRLAIGYTSVKAAACLEHEYDAARDRKNMEENDDEEMMDSKDMGYIPQDSRGQRDSKKYPSYEFEPERADPRFNQHDKRVLLPTPSLKPFDPRSGRGNNSNVPSRFDRRQQDFPPRSPREDFHKKPYLHDNFHQKSYPRDGGREGGRYPPKSNFRDDSNNRYQSQRRHQHHEGFQHNSYEQEPQCIPPNAGKPPSKDYQNSKQKPPVSKPEKNSEGKINPPSNEEKPSNNIVPKKEENSGKIIPESTTNKNDDHNEKMEASGTNNETPIPKEDIDSRVENQNVMNPSNKRALDTEREHVIRSSKRPPNFFETDCLILRGLPLSVTDRDILDFFSDEGLAPTQIHIMLDKQGQPAGDAFCEFNTIEEVERALSKNGTHMGRSVVSVDPVSREELMEAIGIPPPPQEDYPPSYPHQEFRPNYRHPRGMSGYPPRFPRGRGRGYLPPRGRGRGHYSHSEGSGRHYAPPESGGRHHQPPTDIELEAQNVNAFGKPGCVVSMENVPYRAEVQDIIDFFKGFFVPRDNVIRRFNEEGKPTGDARVCFSSPNEALRAVKALNYAPIYNREIHLSLV